MKYYLNGIERDLSQIKTKAPRRIQQDAVALIVDTINANGKLLVNMPCRTGKTFTTTYAAYHANVKLLIVLCGKASAKASYKTDSTWLDNGKPAGYNIVIVDNAALKTADLESFTDEDYILLELTPQLLHKHPEMVQAISKLAATRRTAFVFDEAHFTEQTTKTKDLVEGLINTEDIKQIGNNIPKIYLTASPDTQSLMNEYSLGNNNYYELTKEVEWQLYLEDLKRPVAEREFNYVPVRNCLYVMNKVMDSVYDSVKAQLQDYLSLFVQKTTRKAAKNFVKKSLVRVIETIVKGPEASFMTEDETAPYSMRGNNINLMIKVPVNSQANTSGKTVAANITELIESVTTDLLTMFPQFKAINIKDATLDNNISQDQANNWFDENDFAINIILTQQRLIEGTTLETLDGFLYYCNSGSLCKYKQESGRTLTPAVNKRFGFIFFFDETALANVKAILQAKISKLKGNKKHGPRKLTEEQAKRMTRINPAFIDGDNDELKLVDYSQSLFTKSDLEKKRIRENLFDKEKLLTIPGLRDMIADLLKKMTNNTTRSNKRKISDNSGSGSVNSSTKTSGDKKVSTETSIDEIETEAFVAALLYTYQSAIQFDIDCATISDDLKTVAQYNGGFNQPEALTKLYENEYTYDILMELYEVVSKDQSVMNFEET